MKKITKIIGVLIILLILCFWLYKSIAGQIKTIYSFDEVNFDLIEPKTLVVFDVDETLIQPIDSFYINENTQQGLAFKQELFMQHPEIKNWDIFADIVLKEVQRPLIEPTIIQKINELKQRGITVIACTAMNTGKFGSTEKLEAWRYEHLKSVGFEGSYGDLIGELSLNKHKPVFYKGVLATDLLDKGPVIFKLLDYIHSVPEKIIVFDDCYEQLKSIAKECQKRNISFQGYWYIGAHTKPWNEKLIKFQSEYLIKHRKWLNDEEAGLLHSKLSNI